MVEVIEVPVEEIDAGPHALRMVGDDEALFSLAASIRRIGVLVPLVCRRDADRFCLVAGHRRLAAAKQLGLRTVPVVVGEFDNAQSSEVSLAENLFREDLTPVEVAAGLKDILAGSIMTLEQLAKAMHRTEHWVERMIDMLLWPADVLNAMHADRLSVSAASNLAIITDDEYRKFLLRNASESGATARTTAAWLQAWRSMKPPEQAIAAGPVADGGRSVPMVPQAPCICCSEVFRSDELSHVPVCSRCIKALREVGHSG